MDAELREDGTLVVSASSSVEAYALNRWEAARKSRRGEAKLELRYSGKFFSLADCQKVLNEVAAETQELIRAAQNHPEETASFLESLKQNSHV